MCPGLVAAITSSFFANYTTGEILGFRVHVMVITRHGIKWNFVYHTGNKPTPTDVGALPITGELYAERCTFIPDARPNANCMIANDDASGILSRAYGYYQDRFDIHFYDEKGAWASNPFTVGRNGNVTVTGNLGGGAVFDGGSVFIHLATR